MSANGTTTRRPRRAAHAKPKKYVDRNGDGEEEENRAKRDSDDEIDEGDDDDVDSDVFVVDDQDEGNDDDEEEEEEEFDNHEGEHIIRKRPKKSKQLSASKSASLHEHKGNIDPDDKRKHGNGKGKVEGRPAGHTLHNSGPNAFVSGTQRRKKKRKGEPKQTRDMLKPILPGEPAPRTKKPAPNRPCLWDSDEEVANDTLQRKYTPTIVRLTENGGYAHTKSSRMKIGKANKGNTPWNKGRHRSEADKARISNGVKQRNHAKLLEKLKKLGYTMEEWNTKKKELKTLRERVRRAKVAAKRRAGGGPIRNYPAKQSLEDLQRALDEMERTKDLPKSALVGGSISTKPLPPIVSKSVRSATTTRVKTVPLPAVAVPTAVAKKKQTKDSESPPPSASFDLVASAESLVRHMEVGDAMSAALVELKKTTTKTTEKTPSSVIVKPPLTIEEPKVVTGESGAESSSSTATVSDNQEATNKENKTATALMVEPNRHRISSADGVDDVAKNGQNELFDLKERAPMHRNTSTTAVEREDANSDSDDPLEVLHQTHAGQQRRRPPEITFAPLTNYPGDGSAPKCPTGGPGGLICCSTCFDTYQSYIAQSCYDLERQSTHLVGLQVEQILSIIQRKRTELQNTVTKCQGKDKKEGQEEEPQVPPSSFINECFERRKNVENKLICQQGLQQNNLAGGRRMEDGRRRKRGDEFTSNRRFKAGGDEQQEPYSDEEEDEAYFLDGWEMGGFGGSTAMDMMWTANSSTLTGGDADIQMAKI